MYQQYVKDSQVYQRYAKDQEVYQRYVRRSRSVPAIRQGFTGVPAIRENEAVRCGLWADLNPHWRRPVWVARRTDIGVWSWSSESPTRLRERTGVADA